MSVSVGGECEAASGRTTAHHAAVDDHVPLIVDDDGCRAAEQHAIADSNAAIPRYSEGDTGGLDVEVRQVELLTAGTGERGTDRALYGQVVRCILCHSARAGRRAEMNGVSSRRERLDKGIVAFINGR